MAHPAHNRGVCQRQAALGHHFHQISEAEFEAQLPAHAQDDDLSIKMPACKQHIHTQKPGHRLLFPQSHRQGIPHHGVFFTRAIKNYRQY
jgi:hypothetical protein